VGRGKGSLWRTAGLVVVALALLAVAVVWGDDLYRLLADREAVRAWVAGFGPWGPLVTVLLHTLQVLLAPIPGQTVGLVAGYLYGAALGTLYSLVGVMAGSALAMGLARWFGRPLVARLVGAERLARWDRVAQRQGPVFFFLAFLLPFLPDDLLCFLVGLSPLPIPYMLLLAAVGRLPGLWVASWVGANATTMPWWGWAGLGVGGVALAALFARYRERLERGTLRVVRRLTWRRATSLQREEEEGKRQDGVDDQ